MTLEHKCGFLWISSTLGAKKFTLLEGARFVSTVKEPEMQVGRSTHAQFVLVLVK